MSLRMKSRTHHLPSIQNRPHALNTRKDQAGVIPFQLKPSRQAFPLRWASTQWACPLQPQPVSLVCALRLLSWLKFRRDIFRALPTRSKTDISVFFGIWSSVVFALLAPVEQLLDEGSFLLRFHLGRLRWQSSDHILWLGLISMMCTHEDVGRI